MKVYSTQKEIDADINNGDLKVNGNIKITFTNCIVAGNIVAENINAGNIVAGNIVAGNIYALNIDAGNIVAGNINAENINAENINAENINAGNIYALNINAGNIFFYAACIAYETFKCISYEARRNKWVAKCLDGEIEFKDEKHTITLDGKDLEISKESYEAMKELVNDQ